MIHVTGGRDGDGYSDDILEARGGGEWRKLGTLTRGRSQQGVSIVNLNEFAEYCNN